MSRRIKSCQRDLTWIPERIDASSAWRDEQSLAAQQLADFIQAGIAILDLVIGKEGGNERLIDRKSGPVEEAAFLEVREDDEHARLFGIIAGNGRGRIGDHGKSLADFKERHIGSPIPRQQRAAS